MSPTPFGCWSIRAVHVTFSNPLLNDLAEDDVHNDLSVFFLDETRQALAPQALTVIVDNVTKVSANPMINTVHVDRIPAIVRGCHL
jgi:hypothetical protein